MSVIVNSDSNGRVSVSKFKLTIYLQDKQLMNVNEIIEAELGVLCNKVFRRNVSFAHS